MNTRRQCALLFTLIISLPAFAQDVRIHIKDFMFAPMDLNIPLGTKVTWINDDQIPHTVLETHKVFRSAAMDTDDSFTYQFDNAGTFEYFCALHPQMIGKIVVSGVESGRCFAPTVQGQPTQHKTCGNGLGLGGIPTDVVGQHH